MPRLQQDEHGTKIWLTADDTCDWANRPGAAWPCSELSGHRLFAYFDVNGDLVDVEIDGQAGVDFPSDEFSAITSDYLRNCYGADHPAIRRAS